MNRTLIIAEAGVNHNGSMEIARQLIDAAADAGVDYVKFQTFKTENLVSKSAVKAEYQKQNIGGTDDSQFTMLKALELNYEQHSELIEYCKEKGVAFLSTAFDLESLNLLQSFDIPFWKIPSGEITNFPYLKQIGETTKPVLLSTGMANMQEIGSAIAVLKRYGTTKITLLHCTTQYPAPKNEVNLRAMETMRQAFGVPVGYSDHTQGIEIAVAAVAMGATIIEKHFTLDRRMDGPDHCASLQADELKQMVDNIRNVEQALGHGIKEPSPSEIQNINVARKSIVAARHIKQGELLSHDNITVKRPASGISPMEWEQVVGTIAKRNFNEEDPIEI